VVTWSVIGTLDDAARVAGTLEATPLIDFDHDISPRHHDPSIGNHLDQSTADDRLTDVSKAVEGSQHLLADAPFHAD